LRLVRCVLDNTVDTNFNDCLYHVDYLEAAKMSLLSMRFLVAFCEAKVVNSRFFIPLNRI
jgi:hypothetical protein